MSRSFNADMTTAIKSNFSSIRDAAWSASRIEEKFDLMAVVMSALKDRDITVLFVEHDMDIVGRYADRVLAFYDGTVIADGPRSRRWRTRASRN